MDVKKIAFANGLNKIYVREIAIDRLVSLFLRKITKFFQASNAFFFLEEEKNFLMTPQHKGALALSILAKYDFEKRLEAEKGKHFFFKNEGGYLFLYAPFYLYETLEGVVVLCFHDKEEYAPELSRFFVHLVKQFSLALKKQKNLERLQQSQKKFSIFYTMMQKIGDTIFVDEILSSVLLSLAQMFETKKAWICLKKEKQFDVLNKSLGLTWREIEALKENQRRPNNISQELLGLGQVWFHNKVRQLVFAGQSLGIEIKNLLIIPLKVQDQPIGIIYLANHKRGKFTLMDSQVASSVSMQLSVALTSVKLQERLATENSKLDHANRLKSQFLANISHELRTPMNAIIGYTSCVLEGMDGPINEEQERDLKKVVNGAEHLLALINDVLDLSQIEAGKMKLYLESFHLTDCLEEVLVQFEKDIQEKKLMLKKQIESTPPIMGDYGKVRQILYNLLSNAIKFTQKGYIDIVVKKKDNYVLLEIEDTGIGIPEKLLSVIFEEFRQADNSTTRKYRGTGLGLAITKQLVMMQGGDIWVESEVDRGSKFSFILPACT